jgi:hypothetical protein
MDYSIFYRKELPIDSDWGLYNSHDIFISAFNSSERVKFVFNKDSSNEKYWLIFPEYKYDPHELPEESESIKVIICEGADEAEQLYSFLENVLAGLNRKNICIDITGFMRPQLAFLLKYLHTYNVHKFDLIYSEPDQYSDKEATSFSGGDVLNVRQVLGFEGNHSQDTSYDQLIIGSGYDYQLIKSVCHHKEHATHTQVIGFPSLRPDMYQENILKTVSASNLLSPNALSKPVFAPANDPFITANVLSKTIKKIEDKCKNENSIGISNLYLCPLSTKPQTVGFILCFLKELQNKPVSIIYPFFTQYERETSIGISKVWKYTIEF